MFSTDITCNFAKKSQKTLNLRFKYVHEEEKVNNKKYDVIICNLKNVKNICQGGIYKSFTQFLDLTKGIS